MHIDFLLEITKISKSLEIFGSLIFFLRFLKSIGLYGFSMDFSMDFCCFESVSSMFCFNLCITIF